MNEFEARDYIHNKGANVDSVEDLSAIISEVENDFNYDYGVAPRAIGAVTSCVADYLCNKMGLTGFQAGFVMWDFIRLFMKKNNKCGMRLIDYDNMLYPQYEDSFQKKISKDVWESIVKAAKENLDNDTKYASEGVINHWKSIVDGNVPFGYVVEDD